jgi:hypothetical protein|tara:strand:+ start:337 stop:678 length:342 start_codon:yes stop_codon:yes gene_type:complete
MKSGKELRDISMSQVERNAHELWKEAALEAVIKTAKSNSEFTSDTVWLNIESDVRTHEPRAMGPIMMRAKKLGWVEPSLEFRPSTKRSQHAQPLRVWKSMIVAKAPQLEFQLI